jgi:hypothetical protein
VTAAEQVERAVQRHLHRAEYRFDVAIADLLGEPRPESPEELTVRQLREGFAAFGRAVGQAARAALDFWSAFTAAFVEAVHCAARPGTDVMLYCAHDGSWTGAEGPIRDLGRWPVLWQCDECGVLRVDLESAGVAS